jgi:hypothetical protein
MKRRCKFVVGVGGQDVVAVANQIHGTEFLPRPVKKLQVIMELECSLHSQQQPAITR